MVKLAIILIVNCLSFLGFNQEVAENKILDFLRIENNFKISNTNLTFETNIPECTSSKEMINREPALIYELGVTDIKG